MYTAPPTPPNKLALLWGEAQLCLLKENIRIERNVKPANSEVVDTEQVLCVSPARNHMESEPGFGFREKSMKR